MSFEYCAEIISFFVSFTSTSNPLLCSDATNSSNFDDDDDDDDVDDSDDGRSRTNGPDVVRRKSFSFHTLSKHIHS